jgi:hypothetical protein
MLLKEGDESGADAAAKIPIQPGAGGADECAERHRALVRVGDLEHTNAPIPCLRFPAQSLKLCRHRCHREAIVRKDEYRGDDF